MRRQISEIQKEKSSHVSKSRVRLVSYLIYYTTMDTTKFIIWVLLKLSLVPTARRLTNHKLRIQIGSLPP